MSYVLKELQAAAGNCGGRRRAEQIRYLVVHYTGNDGDTAENNARYYHNSVVKASAHYFVDDSSVWQSVPDLQVAWAVGGKRYASADRTGGGTLYGIVTNTNSISVELCGTARDGTCRASEATLANGAALCRELMERYHIPPDRVCRHFDVTGKLCPAYYVDENAWAGFKKRLEEPVTQEQFDKMMERWLQNKAALEPSGSSQEARAWAESSGLIGGFADGSMQYKTFCTREQAVILLHRLWKLLQT